MVNKNYVRCVTKKKQSSKKGPFVSGKILVGNCLKRITMYNFSMKGKNMDISGFDSLKSKHHKYVKSLNQQNKHRQLCKNG